jgi:hypothetical protein
MSYKITHYFKNNDYLGYFIWKILTGIDQMNFWVVQVVQVVHI